MKNKDDLAEFQRLFLSFQIDAVGPEAEACLQAGTSPREILGSCQACMQVIGERFDAGEYYLPELVVAGEMFKQVSERLRPLLGKGDRTSAGSLILGTPKGDIHHLGKDIFRVLAEANGFTVYDLGVDVPPEAFVDKLRETGAPVLGMSALITTAFGPMQEVVRLLDETGLRKRIHILIGGGVTTRDMARRLGADGQTQDAYEGLKILRAFLQEGA